MKFEKQKQRNIGRSAGRAYEIFPSTRDCYPRFKTRFGLGVIQTQFRFQCGTKSCFFLKEALLCDPLLLMDSNKHDVPICQVIGANRNLLLQCQKPGSTFFPGEQRKQMPMLQFPADRSLPRVSKLYQHGSLVSYILNPS